MPIWLRRFTFKKLKEFYDKQNESYSPPPSTSRNSQVAGPDISPTYTSKASSK